MGFLKKIFGSSKAEVWRDLALSIGAQWVEGGFWGTDHVKYGHKNWTIVLDTFTRQTGNNSAVTYTRMRVPFKTSTQLKGKIYHEHFFFPISKLFGAQDIQLGDREFDKKFVVKASNEFEMVQLLNDIQLKAVLMKLRKGYLEIKDKDTGRKGRHYPPDIDLLYFEALGVVKSRNDLMDIIALLCCFLDRAVHLNYFLDDDPEISVIS